MNVQIKPELQRFIEDQVKLGRYESTDDVMNAAVAALQADSELSPEEIDDLRAKIDVGLAEADRGEFLEFTAEDVIAECRAEFEARKKVS
jgi:antitoxin ParD1/3/4